MKSNAKLIAVLIILGMGFTFLPNIKLDLDHGQISEVNKPKESGRYNESFKIKFF